MRIILLPGMDGSGRLYDAFAAALGQDFPLTALRYPATEPASYRELEALVRAQLPANEPYLMLAESFSGPIGISIAASPPLGLCGLVLCCTFAKNPQPALAALVPLVDFLPARAIPYGLLARALMGRYETAALKKLLTEVLREVSSPTLRARLKEVLACNALHALAALRVPALYLRATHDSLVGAGALASMVAVLPTMRVANIEAPHFLLQTMPMEATEAVWKFAAECADLFTKT